ncbi:MULTISPECIES: DUF3243 domain-containing protein [Alicyclobacillus]|uniref:DUF3243 domain-containing protein n=4 Tax=Alicyclobacillus TaxID=29330 RepID=C8WRW3_ALIAD|nr:MULTISPECIES: DUF3243 domain-containing protein [Alicyclobacillus]ACV59374.1 hypothetical protein Aaci_2367 [Alicyclobacillus acidocaldarius subsp. acidocaldarius DSM 446]AEJ44547.1 hypothetical protein TC41_2652 [Alicyclobacillus acidocaldarius subsp. acidocaldarius Tc-4-1]MDI9260879.1 DUF3243 domain-containing protein [Alicyclobacillus sendaiensis PA2]SIS55618.1 Protein of unknown function [Alicyclobacillus vulcanalis]
MGVMETFENWKQFLGEHVDRAKEAGLNQDQLANIATKVGEFLASKVDPKNPEQQLLKEMWNVADDEERRAIASIMVKMADRAH